MLGARDATSQPPDKRWNAHFTFVQLRYDFKLGGRRVDAATCEGGNGNGDPVVLSKTFFSFYDFDAGEFLERNIEIPSPEQVQEEIETQTPTSTQTPQDFNIDDDAANRMQEYGVGGDNALLFDQVEQEEEEDEFGGIV